MITYFVFLGEFGYELINWQGVVRKFVALNPRAHVVCVSRGGLAPLYGGAQYVDIGDVPAFRESYATGYYAVPGSDVAIASDEHLTFDRTLRSELKRAVQAKLRAEHGPRATLRRVAGERWVFSSSRRRLGECTFGADPRLFGRVPGEGDIYVALDLDNNAYDPIRPQLEHRAALEERAGLSLGDPYVLVQGRRRDIWARSMSPLDEEPILAALGERVPVLVADFSTGRAGDSYSRPAGAGVRRVQVSGFGEQSCLIHHAAACVFTTQGDFGSHIYVPPMMGRDVHAVAPRDVYGLDTTPIDFWNKTIFRGLGRIRTHVAEELGDAATLQAFCDDVLGTAAERV